MQKKTDEIDEDEKQSNKQLYSLDFRIVTLKYICMGQFDK